MMSTIVSVTAQPNHALLLRFADGATGVVSLAHEVSRPGVFAAIKDTAAFSSVRIGPHGRSVEWPGDIDVCADALRLEIQSSAKAAS